MLQVKVLYMIRCGANAVQRSWFQAVYGRARVPYTPAKLAISCCIFYFWLLVHGLSSQFGHCSLYNLLLRSALVSNIIGKWLQDFISFGNPWYRVKIGEALQTVVFPCSIQVLCSLHQCTHKCTLTGFWFQCFFPPCCQPCNNYVPQFCYLFITTQLVSVLSGDIHQGAVDPPPGAFRPIG